MQDAPDDRYLSLLFAAVSDAVSPNGLMVSGSLYRSSALVWALTEKARSSEREPPVIQTRRVSRLDSMLTSYPIVTPHRTP